MRSIMLATAAALMLAAAPTAAQAGYYPPPVVKVPPPASHGGGGGGASGQWAVWAVIGCATGVVVAALAVNASQGRPLTPGEAWTCGLGALFAPPVAVAARPVAVRARY